MPAKSSLSIEARGVFPDHRTKWYVLARWGEDESGHPRESVKNQKDADGDVLTDTLVMRRPGGAVELRILLSGPNETAKPRLRFVGLSFADTTAKLPDLSPHKTAWGRTIAVPEQSQMAHPGGEVWCSPTCVAMVMEHWSARLQRPELKRDVPQIVRAVFDRNWPGTGNWPFNTAFAGSFPGMRAYVTRLSDVSELERWIDRGIPVIVSVSYGELKGTGRRANDGHLVVCVGFSDTGDPIVNDPGTRRNVRKTFPRQNLKKAWAHSQNTVYIIHDESATVPADPFGHWFTR